MLADHDESWPPQDLAYLWHWFNDLTDWRESGWGIGPLPHREIEAWARLFRIDISPFEVDVLRRLDRECRAYHIEKSKPQTQQKSLVEQMRELAERKKDYRNGR